MKTRRLPLVAALLAGGFLANAWHQGWFAFNPAAAQNQQSVNPDALARADELSSVFRTVAKNTLPAVVSIESTGKMTRQANMPPMQSPFGDELENHPLFKDFFRQMPQQSPDAPRQRPLGQGSGFIIDPSGLIMDQCSRCTRS